MIVVSNTSPLINLAMIDRLMLLESLYGKVIIPQAVYDEIVVEGRGQPGAKEVDQLDWIEVKRIRDPFIVTALKADLDQGEAEAIALALELQSDLLLMDERKGRIAAVRFGLKPVGLLGILVSAKHKGLMVAIKPVIDELMTKAGFWVRRDLYEYICQVVGENP